VRLFGQFVSQTGGSLPRQKDEFHCTNNLLHATATSLPYVIFSVNLIELSIQMRDPRDKEAVYAKLRKHSEEAIKSFERTKGYIDVAVQPCPASDYVRSKALELHGLKGDTLAMLTQLNNKLRNGK